MKKFFKSWKREFLKKLDRKMMEKCMKSLDLDPIELHEKLIELYAKHDENYSMHPLNTFRKQLKKKGDGSTKDFHQHANLLMQDRKIRKFFIDLDSIYFFHTLIFAFILYILGIKYMLIPDIENYKYFETHQEISQCVKRCVETNSTKTVYDFIKYDLGGWKYRWIQ